MVLAGVDKRTRWRPPHLQGDNGLRFRIQVLGERKNG